MVTTCQEAALYLRGEKKKSPQINWNWQSSRQAWASMGGLGAQNENRLGVAPVSSMLFLPYPVLQFPEEKHPDC